jgi:hypothetical protein
VTVESGSDGESGLAHGIRIWFVGEPKMQKKYWQESLRAYGFPMAMIAVAIIPGFVQHIFYSGHGGFGWLILPLCTPLVFLRAGFKLLRGPLDSRRWFRKFYLVTFPIYVIAAIPLSFIAMFSLRAWLGGDDPLWKDALIFWGMLVSPFPWFFFRT